MIRFLRHGQNGDLVPIRRNATGNGWFLGAKGPDSKPVTVSHKGSLVYPAAQCGLHSATTATLLSTTPSTPAVRRSQQESTRRSAKRFARTRSSGTAVQEYARFQITDDSLLIERSSSSHRLLRSCHPSEGNRLFAAKSEASPGGSKRPSRTAYRRRLLQRSRQRSFRLPWFIGMIRPPSVLVRIDLINRPNSRPRSVRLQVTDT